MKMVRGHNLSILTLMMLAMGMNPEMRMRSCNPPDADNKVINPPQSEEDKQFYLKRAEEKRLRKLKKVK
jgi:hypothetical protein